MLIRHTVEELEMRSRERFARAVHDVRIHQRSARLKGFLWALGFAVFAIVIVVVLRFLSHRYL